MSNLKPLRFLKKDTDHRIFLIILNNQVSEELEVIKQVWKYSIKKLFVDGASNGMYDSLNDEKDNFIPDIVSGDFDSVRSDVLEFYRNKGALIISTPDQDFTDFTKGFKEAIKQSKDIEFDDFVVIGAFGGRLDQTFANIQTLFEIQGLTCKPVYCLNGGSLACLLKKGKTIIDVTSGYENKYCGLIPIGKSCQHVTTTGLEWNLDDQKLEFGELISTSNTYETGATEVTIETDNPLLWTMEYRTRL